MARKTENRRVNVYINTKDGQNNLKSLRATAAKMRNELALMDMNSKEFVQGTKDYQKVQKRIDGVNNKMRGMNGLWKSIKTEVKQFGMLALAALGTQQLFAQIENLISGNARLSDSYADVAKTTGMTTEEVKDLAKELKAIDTRTPRSQLLELAKIAGKLGIKGKKDILGFVDAADKINVALGEDLGDVETVMRQLGKLSSTFKIQEKTGKNLEEALLATGSAINQLGASSTANEGYLVEFAKRMGGVAPLAGLSLENILGMGAALDSLGQTSEVSSTALSQLFIKMSKNREEFAKFAVDAEGNKLGLEAFSSLIQTDMNEAFLSLLRGVKDNSGGMIELSGTLDTLGLDGGRVIGVLGTLANNIGVVEEQQRIANDSFREGTSVLDEFEKKNNNFAGKLEKVQKWLAGYFVNSAVMSGLEKFVGFLEKMIRVPVSEKIEAQRRSFVRLGSELLTTNEASAERVKLIEKMRQINPNFLKGLEAEKVSNNQIRDSIRAVNQEYLNRIILQQREEEINKIVADAAERANKAFDFRVKTQQKLLQVEKTYGLELEKSLSTQGQIKQAIEQIEKAQKATSGPDAGSLSRGIMSSDLRDINTLKTYLDQINTNQAASNELNGEANRLMKIRKQLAEELGVILGPDATTDPAPDTGGTEGTEGGTPGAPDPQKVESDYQAILERWQKLQHDIVAIQEDARLSLADQDEAEIERIRQHYQKLLEENYRNHIATLESENLTQAEREDLIKAHNAQEVALEDEKQRALEAKREEFKQREKEAKETAIQRINEATMSEYELEKLAIDQHYLELLALADQYGLEKERLMQAHYEALEALQKEHAEEDKATETDLLNFKQQMYRDLANLASDTINFINVMGELGLEQSRHLAIAQIAIDTAAALSSAIAGATTAASAGGPAAPFLLAGYIAQMTGAVMNAFAGVKQALDRSDESSAPAAQTVPTGGYQDGGFTGPGPTSEPAGIVHKGEYVTPNWLLSDPVVADMVGIIEAMRLGRPGFQAGGAVGPPSGGAGTAEAMPAWAMAMNARLDALNANVANWPTKVRALMTWEDWEDMNKEKNILDEATDL